jgi:23S rRNA maturation mini-RNase III
MNAYYSSVKAAVRAEAQAALYLQLTADNFLSDEERDVLRWGRNATGTTPPRLSGGGGKETYRAATAMECLVSEGRAGGRVDGLKMIPALAQRSLLTSTMIQAGYLYLSDPYRLQQLMQHLGMEPSSDSTPDLVKLDA